MEKYFNWFCIVVGSFGGFLVKILGGWDLLLKTVVALVVLDYITGIIKAIYTKQLSSTVGFKGLLKKIMVFIMIATAYLLQHLFGDTIPLREVVITFFVANEGLSLLENAAILIPVPEKIKDVLLQIREKGVDNNGSSD